MGCHNMLRAPETFKNKGFRSPESALWVPQAQNVHSFENRRAFFFFCGFVRYLGTWYCRRVQFEGIWYCRRVEVGSAVSGNLVFGGFSSSPHFSTTHPLTHLQKPKKLEGFKDSQKSIFLVTRCESTSSELQIWTHRSKQFLHFWTLYDSF